MDNLIAHIIYVLIAAAIIVFLDFKYFRYDFQKRLIANIMVVIVFAALYYLFLGSL
jgi:hypothetical protein